MPELQRVNTGNIIGGPGRLLIKPFDGTFPALPEDIVDLTTYDLKADTTFRDAGGTSDGITFSRSFDTEDYEIDQLLGPADTDITSWSHSLSTTLAENTNANKQLAMAGGQIITVAPTYGTATTLTAAAPSATKVITVTAATGFTVGTFVQITEGVKTDSAKIAAVNGTTITLETALQNAYTTAASVRPITKNGYSKITFGTPQDLAYYTVAVLSKKKNGKLQLTVIYKCQLSGDDKDQTWGREKRTIPLSLTAFPVDGRPEDDNVFFEYNED